uniref:Uncharacterized protein n=1 Tax=Cacopsylla melanoneura TaxID=428564 RepID=A0A8D8Y353_9HEMI
MKMGRSLQARRKMVMTVKVNLGKRKRRSPARRVRKETDRPDIGSIDPIEAETQVGQDRVDLDLETRTERKTSPPPRITVDLVITDGTDVTPGPDPAPEIEPELRVVPGTDSVTGRGIAIETVRRIEAGERVDEIGNEEEEGGMIGASCHCRCHRPDDTSPSPPLTRPPRSTSGNCWRSRARMRSR